MHHFLRKLPIKSINVQAQLAPCSTIRVKPKTYFLKLQHKLVCSMKNLAVVLSPTVQQDKSEQLTPSSENVVDKTMTLICVPRIIVICTWFWSLSPVERCFRICVVLESLGSTREHFRGVLNCQNSSIDCI